MILVDTSVWVEHLRRGMPGLGRILDHGQVCIHPFILGELACGNLKNRRTVLELLTDLPGIAVANDQEVLGFIERRALMGRGIGYIDMHLLAATVLTGSVQLWTLDRRLARVAGELDVAPPRPT